MTIPGSASPLLLAADAAASGYQVERSLRFSSSDSASLSRTPAASSSLTRWTWAGWVKKSGQGLTQGVFGVEVGPTQHRFGFNANDTFEYLLYNGSFPLLANKATTQVFRDPSAWFHLVVVWDSANSTASDRMQIYVNGQRITTFSASIDPTSSLSGFVNSSSYQHYISNGFSGYLADIHFIDGQALDPTSFTEVSATTGQLIPKAYTGSFGTNGFWLKFSDNSAATATTLGKDYSGNNNNWTPNNLSVTGLVDHTPAGLSYRDSSTTNRNWDQSTASSSTSAAIGPDRIYWVDLGANKSFNRVTFSVIASGQSSDTSTNFITYFSTSSSSTGSSICGGGCTVTSASRSSGTTPGTITVTFAGFASQTGRYIGITSGSGTQGGTYTYSNFKVYDDQGASNDSLVDTPTSYGTDTGAGGEVRGNYATLNPLNSYSAGLSNGNLQLAQTSNSWVQGNSTIGVSSGKWYWEVTWSSGTNIINGITKSPLSASYVGSTSDSWGYSGGFLYNSGSSTSYGASLSVGDVIGVALDLDAGTLVFYKNGTSQGQATSGLSGTFFPAISVYGTTSENINFGQRPFAYPVSGFKALCDTNLPAPVVAKPNTVFDAITWTGNGSSQSITLPGGFSPDLVWLKQRNGTDWHGLFNTIVGATTRLFSNSTSAEQTNTQTLTAFNSNGFSVGNTNEVNGSGNSYVAWCWDAGSSTVTNTQGSITSQVRANPSAGFSIVTYTSSSSVSTVGHGLGVAPHLIITKNRSVSNTWWTYHSAIGNTKAMRLDTTAAETTISSTWNNTSPTSTVFTVGGEWGSGNSIVAYCFAPVAGYSSFGSYVGNGSADGAFVYTGFRPRWILYKPSNRSATDWVLWDTARNPYNIASNYLLANTSGAEGSVGVVDILSNGFKLRVTSTGNNGAGDEIVYAAFAENPFQYARAR